MSTELRHWCPKHKTREECAAARAIPSDEFCIFSYSDSTEKPEFNWAGKTWPPPRSWMVGNTKVYRSYSDYCD